MNRAAEGRLAGIRRECHRKWSGLLRVGMIWPVRDDAAEQVAQPDKPQQQADSAGSQQRTPPRLRRAQNCITRRSTRFLLGIYIVLFGDEILFHWAGWQLKPRLRSQRPPTRSDTFTAEKVPQGYFRLTTMVAHNRTTTQLTDFREQALALSDPPSATFTF